MVSPVLHLFPSDRWNVHDLAVSLVRLAPQAPDISQILHTFRLIAAQASSPSIQERYFRQACAALEKASLVSQRMGAVFADFCPSYRQVHDSQAYSPIRRTHWVYEPLAGTATFKLKVYLEIAQLKKTNLPPGGTKAPLRLYKLTRLGKLTPTIYLRTKLFLSNKESIENHFQDAHVARKRAVKKGCRSLSATTVLQTRCCILTKRVARLTFRAYVKEGIPLERYLRRRALSQSPQQLATEPLLWNLGFHLIEAVYKFHSSAPQPFCHMDLKIQNVVVYLKGATKFSQQTDAAVLIDFEGACREGRHTSTVTPAFLPPEWAEASIEGKSIRAHSKSDVWALGLLLYEVLYGKNLIFDLEDQECDTEIALQELDNRWQAERSTRNATTPLDALQDLIASALRYDAHERATIVELRQLFLHRLPENIARAIGIAVIETPQGGLEPIEVRSMEGLLRATI